MPTAEYFISYSTLGAPVIVARTGTIAAIVESRGVHTGDLMVGIEAYPGFSGSPVVYWDAGGLPRIGAIAARWTHHTAPNIGAVHSGFLGCFHIKHATELISKMA